MIANGISPSRTYNIPQHASDRNTLRIPFRNEPLDALLYIWSGKALPATTVDYVQPLALICQIVRAALITQNGEIDLPLAESLAIRGERLGFKLVFQIVENTTPGGP